MGKSASDSAHGSAWWWIFDAFLCLSVSIPSINHPIWNFRKTIQHRVPIFHIDKSCEQKKRLLPLNPAKILEEGEGNKGTEWTPDWFSPHELHDFVVYQWYTNCNQNTSLRKHQIEIAWPKAIHLPLFLATKRPPSWVASAVVPANQIPRKPLAQSSPVPLASSGIWSFWSTKSQKRMKIYLNKHLILEDIG